MKFPRNVRLLRSTFDIAPFAVVFFLLIIFVTVATLLPPPGLSLHLPVSGDLPGPDKPTVVVAMDAEGRLFFQNQLVTEKAFQQNLEKVVKESHQPLTLVIQADTSITYGQLVHLTLLASQSGIHDVLLATLPRVLSGSGQP